MESKKTKEIKEIKRNNKSRFAYDDGTLGIFGRAAARIIEAHDHIQAVIDEELYRSFIQLRSWMHVHRLKPGKAHKLALTIMSLFIASCTLFLVMEHFTVYEYAYNGRTLGYVKNQEVVYDILDIAGKSLSETNKDSRIKFVANDNITFKKITGKNKDLDDTDIVLNKLTYMTNIETEATGIYEDGKLLSVVENEKIANNITEHIIEKNKTPDKGMKLEKVNFKGKVELKPIKVMINGIHGYKKSEQILTNGGTYELKHIVDENETLRDIESKFGVKDDSIYDKKGEEKISKVNSGDIVTIKKEVSPIQVELVEKGTMSEIIKFKTIEKESKDYYKGDKYVEQEGVDGKQVITGTVTKVNGKIVHQKIKHKEVIVEAVDKIILVGITERPKTAPTGTFMCPTRNYTITSPFGPRWGRFHSGVDMAGPMGTPIFAADGGTVVRAGYFGGYGNCIDIDHGNGVVTRYGHNSALYVSAGEKVYKGQEIAAMGSTGNSTGPHLHFEIIINGSPIDPMSRVSL